MYARVARFENAEFVKGEALERLRGQIRATREAVARGEVPEGMDEAGVKAIKRMVVLADGQSGTSVSIAFCDNEDDLRSADRMLNAMSPPDDSPSGRVGVDLLEVVIDETMS